uniref:Uncharacterized protein n=1 Tax=Chromera velia CCMP2878 TaxID=1169474 RepID=A0A0G4GHU4_9ALVE|eukprot:Cvel_21953.t1-p1 / transcript=Cvel_21953.t1 / gene=Cvel_21953 / organism=Chromera_velia_CCMP2878 / gene_product=Deoxyribonuclease-2-alpha, putative / transcript_product=Deoxyribonuclease-2-alpha, putative / location=Cvel_scaffold2108:21890-26244(+) / protein_length=592 / sequence_SO=supercontig / SO=protein_coding / is_pseudo=false
MPSTQAPPRPTSPSRQSQRAPSPPRRTTQRAPAQGGRQQTRQQQQGDNGRLSPLWQKILITLLVVVILVACLLLGYWIVVTVPWFFGKRADLPRMGCIGEDGEPVDWIAMFKHPEGGDYHYFMPGQKELLQSKGNIASSTDGPLASTLKQMYMKNQAKAGVMMGVYSDSPPKDRRRLAEETAEGTVEGEETGEAEEFRMPDLPLPPGFDESFSAGSYGHSKGVVFMTEGGGFWLVHSVPHFPEIDETSKEGDYKGIQEGQQIYGQSFLCVSLPFAPHANTIGTQLQFIHPKFYHKKVSQNLAKKAPELASALGGEFQSRHKTRASGESSSMKQIETWNGKEFTSFAKSAGWGDEREECDKDIYYGLVAPSLASNLYAETWMRGDEFGTCCGDDYEVTDIKEMQMSDVSWSETHDHSKWAVSSPDTSGKDSWVCIGGVNRMHSQAKRGGGTLCFEETNLQKALLSSIVDSDECSEKGTKTKRKTKKSKKGPSKEMEKKKYTLLRGTFVDSEGKTATPAVSDVPRPESALEISSKDRVEEAIPESILVSGGIRGEERERHQVEKGTERREETPKDQEGEGLAGSEEPRLQLLSS